MYYDRCLKFRSLGAFLAILSIAGLSGCGAVETAAVFSGGGATDNPLDGGVMSDDGQDFTLTTDGATLAKVEVSSGAEISFDRGLTETSQVAAIDRIVTADGNSAEYDAERQTLTVNASVAGQSISFTTNTGDILNGVFGSTTARSSSQNDTDCDTIVASVSAFCDSYLANVAAAEAEIIALALAVAEENGIPSLFFGVVEDLIKDFFQVVDDFCGGWDELTAGTDPTNPCDVVG